MPVGVGATVVGTFPLGPSTPSDWHLRRCFNDFACSADVLLQRTEYFMFRGTSESSVDVRKAGSPGAGKLSHFWEALPEVRQFNARAQVLFGMWLSKREQPLLSVHWDEKLASFQGRFWPRG